MKVYAVITTSMSFIENEIELFEKEEDAKAYFREKVEYYFDTSLEELIKESAECECDEDEDESQDFFVSEHYAESLESEDFDWYKKWRVVEVETHAPGETSFVPTDYGL